MIRRIYVGPAIKLESFGSKVPSLHAFIYENNEKWEDWLYQSPHDSSDI